MLTRTAAILIGALNLEARAAAENRRPLPIVTRFIIRPLLILLACSIQAQAGERPAPQTLEQYFKHNKLLVMRHSYVNADHSQRVEFHCEDENLPGGENEGASNPANQHCEASLFVNHDGQWLFSDEISLGYGKVKRFTGYKLVTELLEYSPEDALCCPSIHTTQVFDTSTGKFAQDSGSEGKTALMLAILNGADDDRISRILRGKVNVDARDANGNTALTIATEKGKSGIVRLLLEHNADVEAVNGNGDTALIIAAQNGAADILRVLLEKGANVGVKSRTGNSALSYSVTYHHVEAARVLLEHGANPNEKNAYETCMLTSAVATNPDGAVVTLLLDHGADVNVRGERGDTALMATLASPFARNPAIVRLLLDRKANANLADNNGYTALMFAAINGTPEMLQMLLDHGADVNARDSSGQTALMHALSKRKKENADFLIRHGAKVEH